MSSNSNSKSNRNDCNNNNNNSNDCNYTPSMKHNTPSNNDSGSIHAKGAGGFLMNPRNLWQRWRSNHRLTPRFRRRGALDNDDNDGVQEGNQHEYQYQHQQLDLLPVTASLCMNSYQQQGQQQQGQQQQHQTAASRKMLPLAQEHPPSPVANEAALQELMMNTDTSNTDNAHNTTPQAQMPLAPYDINSADMQFSLTPPACAVLPFMVSAKKHSLQIRSKHSSKRRRRRRRSRLGDQTNTMTATNINNSMMEWRGSGGGGGGGDEYNMAYASSDDDTNEELEAWNRETSQCTSPAEITQHYWQVCYGTTQPQESWSAQRVAPVRSCLSSTKARRKSLPARHICSSNGAAQNSHRSPMLPPKEENATELQAVCKTPTTNPLHSNCKRKVQFGALSAAEYERDEPPSSAMKPLREDELMRYSLEQKQVPPEEEAIMEETKHNSQILAAWDGFDDDDFDNDVAAARKRRRRSSSVFSPNLARSNNDALLSASNSPPSSSDDDQTNSSEENNDGTVVEEDGQDDIVIVATVVRENDDEVTETVFNNMVEEEDDAIDAATRVNENVVEEEDTVAAVIMITQDDSDGSAAAVGTNEE